MTVVGTFETTSSWHGHPLALVSLALHSPRSFLKNYQIRKWAAELSAIPIFPLRPASRSRLTSSASHSADRPHGVGVAAPPARPPALPPAATSARQVTVTQLQDSLQRQQYGQAADQVEALLSQTTPSVSDSVFSLALRGLCGRLPWPRVWTLHRAILSRGVVLERAVDVLVLTTAIQGGHLANALTVFHQLTAADGADGTDQRLYATAISALLRLRRRGLAAAESAYQLWLELLASGAVLDACSYRTGMNACVSVGRIQEARAAMQAMQSAGLVPGHGAYNILMKYYAHRGDMGTVRQLFQSMRAAKSRPDQCSYNLMVTGFASTGQLVMAQAVVDKMRREGFKPDVVTFTSLVQSLARAKQWPEAHAMLRQMRDAGVAPTHHTYGVLLNGHLRCNDVPAALEVLALMRRDGLRPNAVVYNMLVKGFARRGTDGLRKALRLVDAMRAEGVVPGVDTYCTVLQAAVECSDEGAANAALERMQAAEYPHDAVVSTAMMKLYQSLGRHNDAVAVFEMLEASAARGGGASVDQYALNALVDVLASAGRMDDAEAAAERAAAFAARHGHRPPIEAYGALIKGYCTAGAVRPALLAFRRFLGAGGRPHSRMANAVVAVCLRTGNFRNAKEAIRAMELLGVPINRQRYKEWFEKARKRAADRPSSSTSTMAPPAQPAAAAGSGSSRSSSREGRSSSTGSTVAGGTGAGAGTSEDPLERFKWWLGLPNSYYKSDWR